MRRREMLIALCGTLVAWPVVTRGQSGNRLRRIALLLPAAPTDSEFQARVGAFHQGLAVAGWSIGTNVQLDYRWTQNDSANERKYAAEIIASQPDLILADGAGAVRAVIQLTRSIPIVFPVAGDPVGAGFVDTLARPGGNATGFLNFEYSTSAKWVELLKQISADVTRIAVLRDPALPTGIGQFGVIQAAAATFKMEVTPVNLGSMGEVERGVAAFANKPQGGLIVTANPWAIAHRQQIIELANQHNLPAVYFEPIIARSGGLISYGPDIVDQYRRAAGYVDRILRGEKPGDLPVQAPNKYLLVINLKAANSIGLSVPPNLVAQADEVIE